MDYEVINLLGQTVFDRALTDSQLNRELKNERRGCVRLMEIFQKTLAIDSENVDAHYNLEPVVCSVERQGEGR
jgi:hypothetical protein